MNFSAFLALQDVNYHMVNLVLLTGRLMLKNLKSFLDDPQPGSGLRHGFGSTFHKVSLTTVLKRE